MNQFPSLPDQAKNATLLIADVIRNAIQNNQLFTTKEEKKRRYDICQACEFFNAEEKRCTKCGCYMEHKTGLTAAQCPEKKW